MEDVHMEEVHMLYSSPDIVRMIKSRMRWMVHIEQRKKMWNV